MLRYLRPTTASAHRRTFLRRMSTLPQLPPFPTVASIILGLPLALWTYKCIMMVLFQRRIMYMGYAPLGSRKQSLDEAPSSKYTRCREVCVQGTKGARLFGVLVQNAGIADHDAEIVFVYFQGNAGNPVQRVPMFQYLCHSISQQYPKSAVLAVAPRSYWKSTPRWPTQSGITQDYKDTLQFALKEFPKARIIPYGHSLGGAAAVCTLADLQKSNTDGLTIADIHRIRGLVLENPFVSIPAMVRALYPQKWLPYRYLGPLVFDKWDTLAALQSHVGRGTVLGRVSRDMLVLLSEYDEVVPREMGMQIFRLATRSYTHNDATMVIVRHALHENAWTQQIFIDSLIKYLARIT